MNKEFREALNNRYPTANQRRNMVYIRNTIKAKNIHIGAFTYWDSNGRSNADFEEDCVFYNVPGHGDLHIGKFCSIADGVEFIMGAANHSTKSFSTYPFILISDDWAKQMGMTKEDMPAYKDTVIGNDVWIGRKSRIMPGVKIGDGAIVGGYSVVTKDVPAYSIVGGDPAKLIRQRFDEETVRFLEKIQWWNFEPEILEKAIHCVTTVKLEDAAKELAALWEEDQAVKGKKK